MNRAALIAMFLASLFTLALGFSPVVQMSSPLSPAGRRWQLQGTSTSVIESDTEIAMPDVPSMGGESFLIQMQRYQGLV